MKNYPRIILGAEKLRVNGFRRCNPGTPVESLTFILMGVGGLFQGSGVLSATFA
jgi:hypothetical protein